MLQKMASFQTRKIVENFLDEDNFIDYKIIQVWQATSTDNIVLILVASKHRKIALILLKPIIWFKSKITFGKKVYTELCMVTKTKVDL